MKKLLTIFSYSILSLILICSLTVNIINIFDVFGIRTAYRIHETTRRFRNELESSCLEIRELSLPEYIKTNNVESIFKN